MLTGCMLGTECKIYRGLHSALNSRILIVSFKIIVFNKWEDCMKSQTENILE